MKFPSSAPYPYNVYSPASDLTIFFENPGYKDIFLFGRGGDDLLYGFDPGSNDGTSIGIDYLIGDVFDNSIQELILLELFQLGYPFAVLKFDIPSVGADRYVLGDEFQSYYTNPNRNSLTSTDFLGLNQYAFIYDFAPDQDIIQLNGKQEDYTLLEINKIPIEVDGKITTISGEYIFSIQQGVPDLVGFVLSKPELKLSLSEDYFWFVGNQPDNSPEDERIEQLGTNGIDLGVSVAFDADGNKYATGSTTGSLFGENQGFNDVWVTKYDPNGNQLWNKQFGTVASEVGRNVVTDAEGNFYLSGETGGSLFGESDPTINRNAWIAKYDSNGNEIWGRQLSLVDPDLNLEAYLSFAAGLQVDDQGNVYVSGTAYFGDVSEGESPSGNTRYVMKFDKDGTQQWTTEIDRVC